MIRRVHHTSFTVSDMDRSLGFYRDRMGMQVIREQGGKVEYLARAVGIPDVDMRVVFLLPTPDSTELLELIDPWLEITDVHVVPMRRIDDAMHDDGFVVAVGRAR